MHGDEVFHAIIVTQIQLAFDSLELCIDAGTEICTDPGLSESVAGPGDDLVRFSVVHLDRICELLQTEVRSHVVFLVVRDIRSGDDSTHRCDLFLRYPLVTAQLSERERYLLAIDHMLPRFSHC